jgi:hypothetical protein
MTKDDDPYGEFGQLLDEHIASRKSTRTVGAAGRQPASSDALLELADLLWESSLEAPPLNSDPTAMMLGLVPDQGIAVDPKALSAARRSSGLKTSDLAARLARRGWKVRASDVLGWETKGGSNLSPALIDAIAFEVGADRGRISQVSGKPDQLLQEVIDSAGFATIAEQFARLRNTSIDIAISALSSRVLAAVHRGAEPTPEQLLLSLRALVKALKAESDQPNGP